MKVISKIKAIMINVIDTLVLINLYIYPLGGYKYYISYMHEVWWVFLVLCLMLIPFFFVVFPFHCLKFFLFISFFQKIFLISKVVYAYYGTFIK